MAKKNAAKKTTRKVSAKTSVNAKKQPKRTKDDHLRGIDALLLELLKSRNVTILSEADSKRLIENIEFDGCIARPKNTTSSL